jgi:hypothetical protein
MRAIKRYVMLMVIFVVGAGAVCAQDRPNEIRIPFTDATRPGTLQVRAFSGRMTITVHEGNDVIVSGRDVRTAQTAASQGLRRLSGSGFAADEENNVVSVRTERFGDSTLEIRVPMRTNLKVGFDVGGNLNIDTVEGDIEVNNLNGNITLTNVGGAVVAHSTNGNVRVSMRNVAPGKPMAFTSVNGAVDVTLPPATQANLKLRTIRGDIYTDFDVQTQPSPSADNRDRGNRSRGFPGVESNVVGTINNGGPDFELRTVNGDVYIRKAK